MTPQSFPEPPIPNTWFRIIGDFIATRPTMVWFPHAGGGAAPTIRACRTEPLDVNLIFASMPGRETRFNDPLPLSLDHLVDQLVAHFPETQQPPVLVGHSFGALVAYRLARRMHAIHPHLGERLAGLVVMAMSAPRHIGHQGPITHLNDAEFADQLDLRFGGIPKALRDNSEAMALFLPTVRQELKLLEEYVDVEESPLKIPMVALSGQDDKAANATRMRDWASKTSALFEFKTLPGGHFFPITQLPEIATIVTRLSSV